MTSPRRESFQTLTEAEIAELSRRGRAVMAKVKGRSVTIGSVVIELLSDPDGMVGYSWDDDNQDGMGIYWVYFSGRVADCHVENRQGELETDGEEYAARRALKVLRAHMVLDDLASV
jgi:hypothetical protein